MGNNKQEALGSIATRAAKFLENRRSFSFIHRKWLFREHILVSIALPIALSLSFLVDYPPLHYACTLIGALAVHIEACNQVPNGVAAAQSDDAVLACFVRVSLWRGLVATDENFFIYPYQNMWSSTLHTANHHHHHQQQHYHFFRSR